MLSGGRINPHDPKAAKISLAELSAAIGITAGFDRRLPAPPWPACCARRESPLARLRSLFFRLFAVTPRLTRDMIYLPATE